ncbi:S8 family serine peptidase [Actinocatenispora rupis]|uniref:Peptidase S8/S53 domain-containing protein n=1 Tax=Actinocatenispora rupis TaxID=519421 RepID=A0A8J3JF33_9ACTN|nr:S8 family serine peptidase [Actinocatenispora rupis]GID15282.1 hypothetical protein Aru02nite_61710 [Actinocatenispora rupis]
MREAQWYLGFLDVPQAQEISNGSGVTVAVVDTGVDATHPDLAGHVLAGRSFGKFAGMPATQDASGHGTSMAGIIAAQGGGEDRTLGVAPGVKVLPVRVASNGDNVSPDAAADGIRWAVDQHAEVINLSFGNNESTPALVSAIHYAEVHDVVVVGAAGNTDVGIDSIGAPGRLKGVLNATGVDASGRFWNGSAQGKYATLSAPAVKIPAATFVKSGESNYSEGSGTSNAAAIVSGVAALVRAKYPELNASNVINRIIKTATDRGPAGWDPQYGFGIVNPVAALTADVPRVGRDPLGGPVPDPLASSPAPDGGATGDGSTTPNAAAGRTGGLSGAALAGVVGGGLVLAVAVVVLVVRSRRPEPAQRPAPWPGGPSVGAPPPPPRRD